MLWLALVASPAAAFQPAPAPSISPAAARLPALSLRGRDAGVLKAAGDKSTHENTCSCSCSDCSFRDSCSCSKQVSGRRQALGTAAAVAAGLFAESISPSPASAAPFTLPPLPYDYKALEPSVDEATMKFHHDKHFNAYMTNLNAALDGKDASSIVELQKGAIKAGPAIRNNGGGYYNHGMFFEEMISPSKSGKPSPALAKAIDDSFGSMDAMKEKFNAAGAGRFGSGWAWLCADKDGKLAIVSTPNQDNPLMEGADGYGMIPFLGLDVWEHAYYLKYQNLRPAYIKAWWDVVNWAKVSDYYEKYALKGVPVVWDK